MFCKIESLFLQDKSDSCHEYIRVAVIINANETASEI